MAKVISLQSEANGFEHQDFLPSIVRIIDIRRQSNAKGLVENLAWVIGGFFEAKLSWVSQHADTRIRKGSLAKVAWLRHLVENEGIYPVMRLSHVEQVDHSINLFETIPSHWLNDHALVAQGRAFWRELPKPLQLIFNELFWEGGRFHRFLFVPASIHGHHNDWHGNFTHAIDVARRAKLMANGSVGISLPTLILAGLIHDAGKADEYAWDGHRWLRTEAGTLIGHKDLLRGWLGAIFERHSDKLPASVRHGLWHTLFSAKHAPAYLDVRESCMLEADILSMSDRMSGAEDLHLRNRSENAGFGRHHDHLRGRPYRMAGPS